MCTKCNYIPDEIYDRVEYCRDASMKNIKTKASFQGYYNNCTECGGKGYKEAGEDLIYEKTGG